MAKVIHASIDEHGNAKGGAAGDQTGKEVCIADFNPDRGWNKVLRCKSSKIVDKMISKGKKICTSNIAGYDQNQRNTLHTQLKKFGYNVSDYIASKVKSETDCSAFMTVLAIAGGVKKLEYDNNGNAPTTSTMVNAFVNSGQFDSLAYKKGMKLKKGDILVKEGSHTAMYIG